MGLIRNDHIGKHLAVKHFFFGAKCARWVHEEEPKRSSMGAVLLKSYTFEVSLTKQIKQLN